MFLNACTTIKFCKAKYNIVLHRGGGLILDSGTLAQLRSRGVIEGDKLNNLCIECIELLFLLEILFSAHIYNAWNDG